MNVIKEVGEQTQRRGEERRGQGERRRCRGGWVKVRFKLALGELLPWKCFED